MDAPQCSWASSTSLPACPSTAAELAQILEQGGSNRAAAGAEIRGRMGSAIARAPPQLRQQRAHQPSGRLCTTQVPKGCVAYNEQPAWYPWCKCIGAIQASFLPPARLSCSWVLHKAPTCVTEMLDGEGMPGQICQRVLTKQARHICVSCRRSTAANCSSVPPMRSVSSGPDGLKCIMPCNKA